MRERIWTRHKYCGDYSTDAQYRIGLDYAFDEEFSTYQDDKLGFVGAI